MLKKLRKMLKKQEGFTLVELMIVVVILGILAGIGVQQYVNVQERAKGAAHNANLRIISSAANMYVMLEGKAPNGINDLINGGYLQEVPVNPFGEDGDDAWVGAYGVTVSGPNENGTYVITVEPEPYDPQGTSD
ncbi:MAG TPA: prepilin-type N-terminal cleavage/methylation domain-containing protein [Limnochordia bacterium]|nr:prepilin-type N-terminal cleavage/methylation domain-containing protein [Limnochordia bacterium]